MNAREESLPHIVLVVARGEAVRNFLYSQTLPELSARARVTLLTLVDHGEVIERVRPYAEKIVRLKEYPEHILVNAIRTLAHYAHFRWVWGGAVKYYWGLHAARAQTAAQKLRWAFIKSLAYLNANRPALKFLTGAERWLSWRLRPGRELDRLFEGLKPDLVFNCSHIHGHHADLPLRIAAGLGIRTAGFIFSWDNLTSRSRIFVPYDHFLMWNESMKSQLLRQYREVDPARVHVTGTPQFDFHFDPRFLKSRQALCAAIGIDPERSFILYTTGLDTDFLDEHKFVEAIIDALRRLPDKNRPQLVVRTYIKGTSPEIQALARRQIPGVVFPPILWDPKWIMPLYEDLSIYTSLLHHCALGINAASTVTLELMMLDKPVINIGMEPPGSILPKYARFSRHVEYDHYRPVVESGGVTVVRSVAELQAAILSDLHDPERLQTRRLDFVRMMMTGTLDGQSGKRVAVTLSQLARQAKPGRQA